MGWIPQKIETRSKVRGLEDSEQKTLNFIVMQALSQDVQLSSLMLDGFFFANLESGEQKVIWS